MARAPDAADELARKASAAAPEARADTGADPADAEVAVVAREDSTGEEATTCGSCKDASTTGVGLVDGGAIDASRAAASRGAARRPPRGHAAAGAGGGAAAISAPAPPPPLPSAAGGGARDVAYVHSARHLMLVSLLKRNGRREALTHGLVRACGLLPHLRVVAPRLATRDELAVYHDAGYLAALQAADSEAGVDAETAEEYGLQEDCPPFRGLLAYCRAVVGGSLVAAEELTSGRARVAVHCAGGRHHAQRDEAAGFCYVNDATIAIMRLRERFRRVLYVDVDVHHGDGVESAFLFSRDVLTLSFHKHAPGFFPGTGGETCGGARSAKGFAVNVPLDDGMDDATFLPMYRACVAAAVDAFRPGAVVLLCGTDGLAGDPLGTFNLTSRVFGALTGYTRALGLPLLVLGGGGYRAADAARAMTAAVAAAAGAPLPDDVPEHEAWLAFAPDFAMATAPRAAARNRNGAAAVAELTRRTVAHLRALRGAVQAGEPGAGRPDGAATRQGEGDEPLGSSTS